MLLRFVLLLPPQFIAAHRLRLFLLHGEVNAAYAAMLLVSRLAPQDAAGLRCPFPGCAPCGDCSSGNPRVKRGAFTHFALFSGFPQMCIFFFAFLNIFSPEAVLAHSAPPLPAE